MSFTFLRYPAITKLKVISYATAEAYLSVVIIHNLLLLQL